MKIRLGLIAAYLIERTFLESESDFRQIMHNLDTAKAMTPLPLIRYKNGMILESSKKHGNLNGIISLPTCMVSETMITIKVAIPQSKIVIENDKLRLGRLKGGDVVDFPALKDVGITNIEVVQMGNNIDRHYRLEETSTIAWDDLKSQLLRQPLAA